MDDTALIDTFVETFGTFDDLHVSRDQVTGGDIAQLVEPWDESGYATWRPMQGSASADDLALLYRGIAGPLPPLFVQLLRRYRWHQIDIDLMSLLGNLPPPFSGFADVVRSDRLLFAALSRVNCVQFGRGSDVDYDPVCFDLGSRDLDGDCPVVKLDHEEILCNDRLTKVADIAPSFRALVRLAIDRATVEHTIRSFQGEALPRAVARLSELTADERAYVVTAYAREADVLMRHQAIVNARQMNSSLSVPLLLAGLEDTEPTIWPNALDGLRGIGVPQLKELLAAARSLAAGHAETFRSPIAREIYGEAYAERLAAPDAAKAQAIDELIRRLDDSL